MVLHMAFLRSSHPHRQFSHLEIVTGQNLRILIHQKVYLAGLILYLLTFSSWNDNKALA